MTLSLRQAYVKAASRLRRALRRVHRGRGSGFQEKGNPPKGLVFPKTHQLISVTPSGNPREGFRGASEQEKHACFSESSSLPG